MTTSPAWLLPASIGDRVTLTTTSGECIIGILTDAESTPDSQVPGYPWSPQSIILDDRTLVPWHAVATLTKHRETP